MATATIQHRPTLSLATATIGPDTWRDATVKSIKLSQAVVQRSDKSREAGRSHDPLPNMRDNTVQASNTVVQGYVREVRAIVIKLREVLLDTNEEIKLLIRGKEALEKQLDHVRKDIFLNSRSVQIRTSRPQREKEYDGADAMLIAERKTLKKLKKMLERQLSNVQDQLQVLDAARTRLATVLQERNRVLDLVCHAASSTKNDHSERGLRTPLSGRVSIPAPLSERYNHRGLHQDDLMKYGVYTARTSRAEERPTTPPLDTLGPFTPEGAEAIEEAGAAQAKSADLRKELHSAIENAKEEQKAIHESVNKGLTGKLAETVMLTQLLQVGQGENRIAYRRSQRHYEMTDKARGYNLGPVCSADLTTRERLTRPHIRMYQRHPGTNLPEAQDLIKGNNLLEQSLISTNRNVALMHLTNLRLKDDERDKRSAASVDSNIIRLRRRRADHRWITGQC